MLNKYPFLKKYQVKPLSNNSFVNKIILLLAISLALFFYLSGIFKIILGIVALISLLFVFSNLYVRLKNKWSRIHYPVWVDYSVALGYSASKKDKSNSTPTQKDIEKAFQLLLRKLFNKVDESRLKSFLKDILAERDMLAEEEYLKELFTTRHPEIGEVNLSNIITDIRNNIISPKDMGTRNRINISLIIGALIEAKYGTGEKEEYFYNIFTNKAK